MKDLLVRFWPSRVSFWSFRMAWCLHIDQDVFWRKHILPTRNALRRLVDGSGGGFLDQVDLRSGHGRGGDEGAVLGTDHGQVALSTIGTVLSGLEFALEATHLGDALLRALFLRMGEDNLFTHNFFGILRLYCYKPVQPAGACRRQSSGWPSPGRPGAAECSSGPPRSGCTPP